MYFTPYSQKPMPITCTKVVLYEVDSTNVTFLYKDQSTKKTACFYSN